MIRKREWVGNEQLMKVQWIAPPQTYTPNFVKGRQESYKFYKHTLFSHTLRHLHTQQDLHPFM
jgi:hypothetical protein